MCAQLFFLEKSTDANVGHIWPKSDPQQLNILDGCSKNVLPFFQVNFRTECMITT